MCSVILGEWKTLKIFAECNAKPVDNIFFRNHLKSQFMKNIYLEGAMIAYILRWNGSKNVIIIGSILLKPWTKLWYPRHHPSVTGYDLWGVSQTTDDFPRLSHEQMTVDSFAAIAPWLQTRATIAQRNGIFIDSTVYATVLLQRFIRHLTDKHLAIIFIRKSW